MKKIERWMVETLTNADENMKYSFEEGGTNLAERDNTCLFFDFGSGYVDIRLFGNVIARRHWMAEDFHRHVTLLNLPVVFEYPTRTTMSRLNALGFKMSVQGGVVYYNNVPAEDMGDYFDLIYEEDDATIHYERMPYTRRSYKRIKELCSLPSMSIFQVFTPEGLVMNDHDVFKLVEDMKGEL